MMNDKTISKPQQDTRRTAINEGYVSEMFCSVQGEGLLVGQRQIFFRTAGCTATCSLCDSPASKERQEHCVIHGTSKQSLPNPIDADAAADAILKLAEVFAPVRAVSLTGGEPLEQADFVAAVAREIKKRRLFVYLETSGLEVD